MTSSTILSEKTLLHSLEVSQLLETESETQVWFTHLNLNDFPANDFPDSGQIADFLFSKITFPEIHLFLLLIERKRIEPWTEKSEPVFFQELIEITHKKAKSNQQKTSRKMRGCVWKNLLYIETLQEIFKLNPDSQLDAVAKNRNAVIVYPDLPLCLKVLKIQKPWGYESWYTGVEKRGVALVKDNYGKTELPYALNMFKQQMLADYSESLILLKTLNPVADDVIGDLYYEMHEEKWEVYVVTEIDKTAWPTGTGIIKAGLNPKKIEEYKDTYGKEWAEILLDDFREAIGDYEIIRRQIDDLTGEISEELLIQELELRHKASNFVGNCPVKIGDIVRFPVFQMHSLQHGIRVVEFQTPHYERLIVMFTQKVLTQNHWDTEDALKKMLMEVYERPQLEILQKSSGLLVERFVDFPQFTADRICLKQNNRLKNELDGKYQLLIIISGQATIFPEDSRPLILNLEESLFLPVAMRSYQLESSGDTPLICLKAMPK